jgi:hypothetical protein
MKKTNEKLRNEIMTLKKEGHSISKIASILSEKGFKNTSGKALNVGNVGYYLYGTAPRTTNRVTTVAKTGLYSVTVDQVKAEQLSLFMNAFYTMGDAQSVLITPSVK